MTFIKTTNVLNITLIFTFVAFVLMPYVLSHLVQLESDSGNGVSSRPQLLSVEISLSSVESASYRNRAFTLDISDNLGYCKFWRYRYAHVYMIRHHMPFNDLASPLASEIVKHRA